MSQAIKRFHPFKPFLRAAIREGRKTQTRRIGKPRYKVGDIVVLPEPLVCDVNVGVRVATYQDDDAFVMEYDSPDDLQGKVVPWRWQRNVLPSIHMPTMYGRTFLTVTDVRSQQLQDISMEDAVAEGIEQVTHPLGLPNVWKHYGSKADKRTFWLNPRMSFMTLWHSINTERGYAWDSNPTVVAYTWRRTNETLLD